MPPSRPLRLFLIALPLLLPVSVFSAEAVSNETAPEQDRIINADFETGNPSGWKDWRFRRGEITTNAHAGHYAIALGPESARCVQEVKIRPDSRYRLSAWVKTVSGAEEVEISARDFGGSPVSAASALPDYTRIAVEFTSAHTADSVTIMLRHPVGPGKGYVDSVDWSIWAKPRRWPCRNSSFP